jgi:hypothetical protein
LLSIKKPKCFFATIKEMMVSQEQLKSLFGLQIDDPELSSAIFRNKEIEIQS